MFQSDLIYVLRHLRLLCENFIGMEAKETDEEAIAAAMWDDNGLAQLVMTGNLEYVIEKLAGTYKRFYKESVDK